MKRNTILMSVVTLLTFIGCGGGSSSPDTVTGKFRDTYVSGLNYKCSSGTKGLTNAEGEYTCNVGDTVTFSLGGYNLGTVSASNGVVTPKSLYPSNAEAEVNVAQLLQSLNTGDADGIITIPQNFDGLDDVTIPPTDATFDASMTTTLASLETGAVTLVSEADAVAHLQETYTDVLTDLVKGQTFYSTIYTEMNTLESFAFNADATTSTWTELVGGSCTGSGSIAIEGMNINFTPTTDSCSDSNDIGSTEVLTVTEIKDDYILVAMGASTPQRLYFDEAKARDYFISTTSTTLTKSMLEGKTFYLDDVNEISTLTFNNNQITWSVLFSNEGDSPSTYQVANNEIIIENEEEPIKFIKEESDKLIFSIGNERIILFKTMNDLKNSLEASIPNNGLVIDPTNDSKDSNVQHDGFELTSLKTEIVNDNLVITVKAKGNILEALQTTPRAGFGNILWISISNDYEFGLMSNGKDYLTKNHWDSNHNWQSYDNQVQVTHNTVVSNNSVKITLALSEFSTEIRNFEYIHVGVQMADDHNDPDGYDESTDEEHIFDEISTVVKVPKAT